MTIGLYAAARRLHRRWPRSISTPFAMEVSADIGGLPELTAVFVVVTGLAGAVMGDVLLARLPFVSALARGAVFGAGAHAAGTARRTRSARRRARWPGW